MAARSGVWQQWWEDGIRVYYKQSTVYVRANGWEVNATRHPIYNYVNGPSHWRFDIAIRPLSGTGFETKHGTASKTCYPHGIIGQSWDGDDRAVDGAVDDYTYRPNNPVITTKAMAEGAIEGTAAQYVLKEPHDTSFVYSRFDQKTEDTCASRDVNKLVGKKTHRLSKGSVAGSDDSSDDSHEASVQPA